MISLLYRLADRARDWFRRRHWTHDQAAGRRGEDLAHRLLRRQGLTVVARNYRPRSGNGEIDLVAREGETLVFVEVKLRATSEFGAPEQAVDREKRRHLERAARDYARRAGVEWERIRFDVVSVTDGSQPEIIHFRNVFRPKRTL
jgi:putative endonuclease